MVGVALGGSRCSRLVLDFSVKATGADRVAQFVFLAILETYYARAFKSAAHVL